MSEPLTDHQQLANIIEIYADQPEDVADRVLAWMKEAGYRRAEPTTEAIERLDVETLRMENARLKGLLASVKTSFATTGYVDSRTDAERAAEPKTELTVYNSEAEELRSRLALAERRLAMATAFSIDRITNISHVPFGRYGPEEEWALWHGSQVSYHSTLDAAFAAAERVAQEARDA